MNRPNARLEEHANPAPAALRMKLRRLLDMASTSEISAPKTWHERFCPLRKIAEVWIDRNSKRLLHLKNSVGGWLAFVRFQSLEQSSETRNEKTRAGRILNNLRPELIFAESLRLWSVWLGDSVAL
jgi:hypothetical protein